MQNNIMRSKNLLKIITSSLFNKDIYRATEGIVSRIMVESKDFSTKNCYHDFFIECE